MSETILELRDLWVGLGPDAAVQGVSTSLKRGQVLGVLGGAEAGKSRLLRCIGLEYPPSRGAVYLRGVEITGSLGERRRELRSGPVQLVHPPAPSVADRTGSSSPSSCSPTGPRPTTLAGSAVRQRIQMAKALTAGVDVLLLDEPFVGVVLAVQIRILELLHRLRNQVGTVVVIATRDEDTCRMLADDVLVLHQGLAAEQSPLRSPALSSVTSRQPDIEHLRSA